ncbi:unnamed protein product, partial [Prorocentrum cordatum]
MKPHSMPKLAATATPQSASPGKKSSGGPLESPLTKRSRFVGKQSKQSLPPASFADSKHHDALYGPREHIRHRFPGLIGLRLLNTVNKWYRAQKDQRLPFFSSGFGNTNGTKLLVMHDMNRRDQGAVEEDYTLKVLSMGSVPGVRGQPWAVLTADRADPDGDGVPPYQLLTFGTLTRAIYNAISREPENPQVEATLEAGLHGAQIYSCRTPPDVCEFLMEFHNEFHQGSGYTLIQFVQLTEKSEAQWKAHAHSSGQDVTNQDKYNSPNVFNDAKASLHARKRRGMYQPAMALLGATCEFTELKNEFAAYAIHELMIVLETKYKHAMPKELLITVGCEILKFMVPTVARKEDAAPGSDSFKNNQFLQSFVSTRELPWILNSRDN